MKTRGRFSIKKGFDIFVSLLYLLFIVVALYQKQNEGSNAATLISLI
jgi:hypothetical protein